MRRVFVVVATVSFAVYACTEATDGVVPSAPCSGDGGTAGSSGSSSSGSSGASGSSSGTPPTSSSTVLVNEISGSAEWVEIYNSGAAAVNLAGWSIADRDKSTGEPKLSEAVIFPNGTTLPAKAYGMVRGGGIDGGKSCPDGGQVFCFNAEFGISTKNGETIFLLASDGGVVGSVAYPPDGSVGDDTWGRIPSGEPDGVFQPTVATPGAVNQAK